MKIQLLLLLALSCYSTQLEQCPAIADIFFILDASDSVTPSGYAAEQSFVSSLIDHLYTKSHDVQYGALTFASNVTLRFTLGTHSSNAAVKSAIQSIPYTGGATRTYRSLDYVRQQGLLTPRRGARTRSTKFAIVVTNGLSDNTTTTATAAAALRATGVKVIAVAISGNPNTELHNIAGVSRFVFSATDFSALLAIELLVATGTCKIKPTTSKPTTPLPPPTTTPPRRTATPIPCNPGYQTDPNNPKRCIDIDECQGNHPCQQECANRLGSFRCNCNLGFAIDPADRTKCKALRACVDQVDVFFLLDESDNVHPNSYKHVKRFPAKLVHYFFIPAGAKFGAAKVGTGVTNLFGLDTYSKRIDVATALRATTRGGGQPNIYLGLHYVSNNNVFSSASGGRDTAPNVVVVVLGGPSAIPDRAKEAADRVRSRGGQVIAVGAGPNLTRAELRSIASSDKDTFLVPTLDDLDDVEKSVMEQICPSTRT